MRKSVILLLSFVSGLLYANSAPTVTQVTASQRTDGSGVVDISFKLTDSDNDRCSVSFLISTDGGTTWDVTPSSSALSSTNLYPGNRTITWNSKLDVPGIYWPYCRVKVTADDGKDMVYIPGGTFQMGDSVDRSAASLPVHTVTLSPFYIAKYEITNQQYCDFLNSAKSQKLITVTSNVVYRAGSGASYPYCNTYQSSTYSQINWNGSMFSVRTKSGRSMDDDPMVCVSWYGAVAFCNWRSQQEDRPPCYDLSTWECDFSKKGYRLPTEAQWEYAARGGLPGKRFPWGDTISHAQANYCSDSQYSYDVSISRGYHPLWNDGVYPYTAPVGSFPGNDYGLCDMVGNVWEWCNDWYGNYSAEAQTNPTGPQTGTYRTIRCGGWWERVYSCGVAARGYHLHC